MPMNTEQQRIDHMEPEERKAFEDYFSLVSGEYDRKDAEWGFVCGVMHGEGKAAALTPSEQPATRYLTPEEQSNLHDAFGRNVVNRPVTPSEQQPGDLVEKRVAFTDATGHRWEFKNTAELAEAFLKAHHKPVAVDEQADEWPEAYKSAIDFIGRALKAAHPACKRAREANPPSDPRLATPDDYAAGLVEMAIGTMRLLQKPPQRLPLRATPQPSAERLEKAIRGAVIEMFPNAAQWQYRQRLDSVAQSHALAALTQPKEEYQ